MGANAPGVGGRTLVFAVGGDAVSCEISLNESFLWVSNQRLSTLLSFALQVGGEVARSDEDRRYVERLRRFDERI